MTRQIPPQRTFLFLQGPHGPFFQMLGRALCDAGNRVWRVGFNAGDRAFWPDADSYVPYSGRLTDWSKTIDRLLRDLSITDIALYGDTRPIHAEAIAAARRHGIRIHVFEEGYMRPYWVTYERDGANGHSRLMNMSVPDMKTALARSGMDTPMPPAHWGDMRQHMFYGALYHWFVMFRNHRYRNFQPHRALNVRQEFRLHLRRLLLLPLHAAERRIATTRIRRGSFPYHLVLLQLEHDSSFQAHSPFADMPAFLNEIVTGFSRGAPRHHHLVFKAHPLEDDRAPLRRTLRQLARAHGLQGRVHFVRGGKLAPLLDGARSAVTVNSTAGQQALWRGLPLKVFGQAVYAKPELVSRQALPEFFASPKRPDMDAYRTFRQFLLQTSQVPGGYYSLGGRRQLLRQVLDLMLAEQGPYAAMRPQAGTPEHPLRLVRQANRRESLAFHENTG
ncbi:capsular biosynthesis protein [Rhodobacteraceae bacterium F11138]|nr:capsular biosynthesis protein [Rhodobacteraceae bacterium F11138]